MTTGHAPTIQDASTSYWKLAGSDLFVLAKPDGEVVALHVTDPGFPPEAAERDLKRSVESGRHSFLVVRQRPPLLGFSSPHHRGRGSGIARTRLSGHRLSGELQRRATFGARCAESDCARDRSRRHCLDAAAKRRSDARQVDPQLRSSAEARFDAKSRSKPITTLSLRCCCTARCRRRFAAT